MSNLQSTMPSGQISESETYDGVYQEPDLGQMIRIVWDGKWLVIVFGFLFAVLAVVYAIMQPNVYKAETLLAPVSESANGGLASLASGFGGLTSLAGINLPMGKADQATLAIAMLKSRAFIQEFIRRHNLAAPLIAAKGWDDENQVWIYDPKRYDPETGQWFKVNPKDKFAEPSDWELYKAFSKKLTVNQDKKTSLVRISISSYSPVAAKQWIDWLVEDLNEHLRSQDIKEAEASIAYLEKQIQQTSIANMQQVFYQLIEEQAKKVMLARVSADYVFETIDPAFVPEEKSGPRRTMMVLFAGFVGGVIGVMVVLWRHFVRKRKSQAMA